PVSARFDHDYWILVDHGVSSMDELDHRLHTLYPTAAVHARELTGEANLIWYLYREGRWVPSGSGAQGVGDHPHDRPPRRSSSNRAVHWHRCRTAEIARRRKGPP